MLDYTILLIAGLLSGILSSLFGLGGGLTIVPALLIVLPFFKVSNSVVMHIAIGTSLAIMFINSLNSARSHHLSGNINWKQFTRIMPYILGGTIIGCIAAYSLPTSILMLGFIVFLLVIIVKFLQQLKFNSNKNHKNKTIKPDKKDNVLALLQRAIYGLVTGIVAACVGGGSSLIMVPFLKQAGLQIKQAAGLSVAFNILIALAATLSYALLGSQVVHLPKYSTGFIFWPAFLWIIIGSFVGVPIGTWLANKLAENVLTSLYFLMLLIIFITMVTKYVLTF